MATNNGLNYKGYKYSIDVKPRICKWELVFDGEITSTELEIKGISKGLKSKSGAIEHAFNDFVHKFNQLVNEYQKCTFQNPNALNSTLNNTHNNQTQSINDNDQHKTHTTQETTDNDEQNNGSEYFG